MIDLSSYDYLGFRHNPVIITRVKEALDQFGLASEPKLIEEAVVNLSEFFRVDHVVLYASLGCAYLSLIQSILDEGDGIISDQGNRSEIDAILRLGRLTTYSYQHNNIQSLKEGIEVSHPRLILSEGVFIRFGDVVQLPELVALTRGGGPHLLIDNSHAIGVLGRDGRGVIDHFNLHGDIDFQLGSLSYALGAPVAYIGGKDLPLSSDPLPAAVVVAVKAGIEILTRDSTPIRSLWEKGRYFREGLIQLGFDLGGSETPIISISIGEERKAERFGERLTQEGILVNIIDDRVQLIVTAVHEKDELNQALDAFEKVGKELAVI
ncbi:hypothetical protein DRP53_06290 [candidate division WOR-3 bacterium]|uniref:Aminotransferase class I/classII large domain-containing protein n=1 Tax=candidate division WOR-3 bacterium TaxID=2052148 RepID=A0A660SGY1_UNCW3|nr:MAG: hypothetical protein DRP53_06290 [candidate division WOR-3 bacterium]